MSDYVYELMAKIGLDDTIYNKKLKGAGATLKDWGAKAGKIAIAGAKAAAAATVAVGAATVAIGKQALAAYADYEQLVGGVETLFKDSAGIVQEYAANAYRTAGLSANEYMETVTSFSASLLQSLGGDTEKAAQYSDKAVTDMSDNANKMGSDMSSIQAAYSGFAKQNYTMLDNLKLGYGGTKTEMERLITDAEKLDDTFVATRDANGDLTMSYADIVDAIHIVQTEMGITGTTAKEASTTIQGSVKAMKSSWQNLLVGLADENADFDGLMDNFVDSVMTAGDNILPRIEKIMTGVSKLITKAVTKFGPVIIQAISNNLPTLISAGMQILVALITGIITALPQLVEAIPEILAAMADAFKENWPAIKEAGIQLLIMYANGITAGAEWIAAKLEEVVEITKTALVTKWNQIVTAVTAKVETLKNAVVSKWNDIKANAVAIWENIKTAVAETAAGLKEAVSEKLQAMVDKVQTIIDAAKRKFEDLKEKIRNISEAIKGFFNFNFSMPHIKMPHLTITYESAPAVIQKFLGIDQIPHFSVEWYRKAMENPYMFTRPTLMGFGDGAGGEIVYGHESLLNDIREATGAGNPAVEEKLDQVIGLMETIIQNGLNANLDKTQVYRTINDENRKRSRATNYNSLAMA